MTEALKECPLCQDPMRISGQYFRHVADADGECLLSRHAWPLEDLPRWNTRANDCAELVEALEELYKAAKRTSGIGATPGHHFVLLLAAVLKAKSALAKHKEPAQ